MGLANVQTGKPARRSKGYRFARKTVPALIIGAVVLGKPGWAQIGDVIPIEHACSYFGERIPETVVGFASDAEAEEVIRKILAAAGLARNFRIQAAGVPNAAAVIKNGERLILYNQYFMKQVFDATHSTWAAISIMAHEIGHHLNGHTLALPAARHTAELEADYWSGFILRKMGASMEDARAAMGSIGSDVASSTHPAKHDRLAAITSGWVSNDKSTPGAPTNESPKTASDVRQDRSRAFSICAPTLAEGRALFIAISFDSESYQGFYELIGGAEGSQTCITFSKLVRDNLQSVFVTAFYDGNDGGFVHPSINAVLPQKAVNVCARRSEDGRITTLQKIPPNHGARATFKCDWTPSVPVSFVQVPIGGESGFSSLTVRWKE